MGKQKGIGRTPVSPLIEGINRFLNMRDFEYIVIGKGLIGSAATRYLSQWSSRVAVIGPDEPANQTTHNGVFASHYDQGRLTRLISRDVVWARLARMSIDNYRWLEEQSGISFYNPVGMLVVDAPHMKSHMKMSLEAAELFHIPYTLYQPGDRSWQNLFPDFAFPDSYTVLHEPAPAGYINPRDMLRAQLTVAEQQGATVIREIATQVQQVGEWVEVETAENGRYRARKLLVAAGAFSNCFNLLPHKPAFKPETETIILGEVSEADATRLEHIPTLIYFIEDPQIADIYMTPPIQYGNGRFYIKLGANTIADQWPTDLADIQTWFQHGDSDVCKPALQNALQTILPGIQFLSFQTKRCIICRTPNGYPTISPITDTIFVAAGGNGEGAKSSDALGFLAAGLAFDGRWPQEMPYFSEQ